MRSDRNDYGHPSPPTLQANSGKELLEGGSVLDRIIAVDSSLTAIRNRIDDAYNHICMDLPEINLEIYRTFQQAFDALDSLSDRESPNTIRGIVTGLESVLMKVADSVKRLRDCDARILDTFMTACPLPLCSEDSAVTGFKTAFPSFIHTRNALVSCLRDVIEREEALASRITWNIAHDVRSLEYTLDSVVSILKDLISRSSAMKDPVLKIMSGLQTHDIVNQDITTITLGLRKMLSLQKLMAGGDAAESSPLFLAQAASLSRGLVSQLIGVIRDHGHELESEIVRIEAMVSHVKEDKDVISDFLLTSRDGASTFDIALAEVREMFDACAAGIAELKNLKESQRALAEELAGISRDLGAVAPGPLLTGDTDLPSRATSPLQLQAGIAPWDAGLEKLEDCSRMLQDDARLAGSRLEGVKDLLVQSVRGIDACSGRCLEAIMKFRQDIRTLMTTLDGSEGLLDGLEIIALHLAGMPEDPALPDPAVNDRPLPEELTELIRRLKNPHCNALVALKTLEAEEGFTFF